MGLLFLPIDTTEALNTLSVTQEKLRLFLDKRCQYLPFQDWSVKCKRMVDTGILILVQLGKQVLVMQGKPPGLGFSIEWDVLGACRAKDAPKEPGTNHLKDKIERKMTRGGCDGGDAASQAPTPLLPQSQPKVVCGTIKLCQPRNGPTGTLNYQQPPPAATGPTQDLADLIAPFMANVPLLLHPQDQPHGEAQVPWHRQEWC